MECERGSSLQCRRPPGSYRVIFTLAAKAYLPPLGRRAPPVPFVATFTAPMTRCSVHHLAKRFGPLAALRDVSFDVRSGEVLGLLGPNGAGKTTLLACMAGLVAPDAGAMRANGREITDAERRALAFYLPDGITPWGAQSASWLLHFSAGVFGTTTDIREDVLAVLRIAELRDQRIDTLSKGQRKRLLLAMTLLVPQPVLLLDEPFDGLDLRLTRDVIALFRRVVQSGRSLVVSIHAMHDATKVCDRLVLMDDGRTVAEGTLSELRLQSGLPDAQLDEIFLAFA